VVAQRLGGIEKRKYTTQHNNDDDDDTTMKNYFGGFQLEGCSNTTGVDGWSSVVMIMMMMMMCKTSTIAAPITGKNDKIQEILS
jgi:hypothetical protein